jgi:RNA polymerase sigma-70 factor (ECF subfamily)
MIRDSLAAMPAKYQEVIRMRHDEELEYQEIADKLGQPLGTVKANLFRARKRLVALLKRHGRHFEEYMADEEGE